MSGVLPGGRILELIAEAQKVAGPEGIILAAPSDTPTCEVQAGTGTRLKGHVASRYFFVSPARFGASPGGRVFSRAQEARDAELVTETAAAAQILFRTQVARIGLGAAARAALIPLLNRSAMRGAGLCVVASAFDEELLDELLRRHLSGELRCPAFCVDEQDSEKLRKLCIRRNTGFFGEKATSVSLFFDVIEVRADELLMFYQGGGGAGLPRAAQLVIGRTDPQHTQATLALVRRLLRGTRE